MPRAKGFFALRVRQFCSVLFDGKAIESTFGVECGSRPARNLAFQSAPGRTDQVKLVSQSYTQLIVHEWIQLARSGRIRWQAARLQHDYTTLNNRYLRMPRVELRGPFLLSVLGFAAVLNSIWMGSRFGLLGYVIGLPAGAAMILLILSGAALTWTYIQGLLFTGVPGFPVCRNGCCRGGRLADPGVYTIVWNDDWTVRGFRCRCGDVYQKIGRRFVEVAPDGSFKPYLIWSRVKGWRPDPQPIAG